MKTLGIGIVLSLSLALASAGAAADKWPGVDETVVEKYAQQHGREAKEPLINTDQGDLLLFVFLLGGAAGGFAAGYYWRTLVGCREDRSAGQAAGDAPKPGRPGTPHAPRAEER